MHRTGVILEGKQYRLKTPEKEKRAIHPTLRSGE
ncbi:hypothetical protein BMS3Bbin06_02297 [bacterium BMS3Bbin06]|nr:hypothetical protein BMS3Bbin06_02297 [bacterium BMS3Bbin06]